MLSQEELKSLLSYNPNKGIFTWKISTSNRIKIGDKAGYIADNPVRILIRIHGKAYKAHRLAFLYMTGRIPEFVDHIDTNSLNNKWKNLRIATKSQNNRNINKQKNNTSGFKGVYLTKSKKNPWRVRIADICVGYFSTPEEAAKAYDKKAIELFGEFANTNFKSK